MTERPNFVLAILLAAAAVVAALIASGVSALGASGVASLAVTLVGALSACAFFLAELERVPLSSVVLAALVLASAFGFVRAIVGYRRERRLLNALPLTRLVEGPLAATASSVGVQLYRSPARRPAAFCFGLLPQRIAVTDGFLQRLTPDEQVAAVWHEVEHARVREPLRCLIGRLAVSAFFWVPVLRDLLDRYLLTKELAADRVAVDRTSRRALAGALYEVLGHPSPRGAIGFADAAAARIDRLFDPAATLPPLFRVKSMIVSLGSAIALALVFVFPARVDLGENAKLHSMLTTLSLHGLLGMAAGLALNVLVLGCVALFIRRMNASRKCADARRALDEVR